MADETTVIASDGLLLAEENQLINGNGTPRQTIRLAKTADGDYSAAPIVEADPDRLWGKEVITSSTGRRTTRFPASSSRSSARGLM